jgi:hypothetical protein
MIRSCEVSTVAAWRLGKLSEGGVTVGAHAADTQRLGVHDKENGWVGRVNFHAGPDLRWAGPAKFFSK